MSDVLTIGSMVLSAFAAGYWFPRGSWSTRIHKWQRKTFGQSTVIRSIQRCQEEWDELQDEAALGRYEKASKECADVVIVLSAVCANMGYDLAQEVEKKMAINRARKWNVDGTGCGYHVK